MTRAVTWTPQVKTLIPRLIIREKKKYFSASGHFVKMITKTKRGTILHRRVWQMLTRTLLLWMDLIFISVNGSWSVWVIRILQWQYNLVNNTLNQWFSCQILTHTHSVGTLEASQVLIRGSTTMAFQILEIMKLFAAYDYCRFRLV